MDRLHKTKICFVSSFTIHTGLFPLEIHGRPIGEFGVDLGVFRGDMTILLPAFERAPRAASSALLFTKIACRVCTQCFLTSPIGNTWGGPQNWGFGAKWGKNFLIG